MTKAEKIMNSKPFMKMIMDKYLSIGQSDKIWKQSVVKLDEMLLKYRDLPEKVHAHTDNYIFPSAAVYLTAKEIIGTKKAYRIIEKSSAYKSGKAGKALAKIMRLPFMPDLFVAIWDPMTKKKFGPDNGFKNVFYPNKNGEFRMDITSCPYMRYFTELGCPELTKIFCRNDELVYGDLPGLEFIRKGTIGRGYDKCDFYIRRRR